MADTLKYNEPGAGPAVATDDVGGVHYQRMKLDVGGNGLASPVEAVDGKIPVSFTNAVDTELPAASLLADNQALPTAPQVGAVLKAYDGATTDLVRDIVAAHALLTGVGTIAAGLMVFDPFDGQYRRVEINGGTIALNLTGSSASPSNGPTFDNRYYRGLSVLFNITAVSSTGTHTIQLSLEERDLVSGAFFHKIWSDSPMTSSSLSGGSPPGPLPARFGYKFYPGVGAPSLGSTGVRAFVPIVPARQYRLAVVLTGGTWSYQVAAHPVM